MKHHVFDLDGTLIDSMPYWAAGMIGLLREQGIEPPEDIIKIVTPLGNRGTAEYFISLGVDMDVETLMAKMREKLVPLYENVIPLKECVREGIAAVKERGDEVYVLTASPHVMTDPVLKRNGAFDDFKVVWSSDDFNHTKAQKEIYFETAERIGCRVEDIVFYDDNPNALIAAREAGVETVGVYDKTSVEVTDYNIADVCDRYINSFKELL